MHSRVCHWSMALSVMPQVIWSQVSMLQLVNVAFQFLRNLLAINKTQTQSNERMQCSSICLPRQGEHLLYNSLHMTVCFINIIRLRIISGTAAGIVHVVLMQSTTLTSKTRGQSNLTKSASRGAHFPVRGHPRGSKVVPLNSWGMVSY